MRLPPEILIAVLPFLDVQDIKTLRQCSKLLGREGAKALFHTVIVYCTSASFSHLRAISRNAVLRQHVRRIIYVPNRYVPNLNLAQWRHHYSNGSRGTFGTAVWLGKPYDVYKSLSSEQEQGSGQRHLGCFPGLVDIRFYLREAQKPNQGLLHLMIARTFCEPDGDFESAELIEATKTVAQIIPVFKRLADLHQPRPEPCPAAPKLQVLHLEGISVRLVSILTKFCSAGMATSLSNLQELQVQFVVSKHDWDLETEDAKAIGKLISAAPKLKDIEVAILCQHFRLGFEDMFPEGQSWPLIRHVKFYGITFNCQDLHGFVERFSESMCELTISISDERFEEPASWQMCISLLVGSVIPLTDEPWAVAAKLKHMFENATMQYRVGADGSGLTATWT